MPNLLKEHTDYGSYGNAPVLTMGSAGIIAVAGGLILQLLFPLA